MARYLIQPFTDLAGTARYRIVCSDNGEVIVSSEAYASKSNRNRAMRSLQKLTHLPVEDADG